MPEYIAVKEWVPIESVLRLSTATPDALRFAVPSNVEPSKKLTAPSGDPVGIGVTEAVSVTDCAAVAGLGPTVNDVLVTVGAGGEMTCVTGVDIDVAKFTFPE